MAEPSPLHGAEQAGCRSGQEGDISVWQSLHPSMNMELKLEYDDSYIPSAADPSPAHTFIHTCRIGLVDERDDGVVEHGDEGLEGAHAQEDRLAERRGVAPHHRAHHGQHPRPGHGMTHSVIQQLQGAQGGMGQLSQLCSYVADITNGARLFVLTG